jgi:outer membrane receptor for ferrienterochelin and colicins
VRNLSWLYTFVLVASSFQAIGSNTDSLNFLKDTTKLDPVVVTGLHTAIKTSESVVKFKVIDRETIIQLAPVNLADILSRQSNIRIANDNLLGSSISLQNLSGQQIKLLLNGMPITGRENGNINLDQILPENIERIEIIEGPLSVIYGTDALGGIINIITKQPIKGQTQTNVFAYSETVGHYNFGGGVMSPIGKNNALNLSFSRNFFEGFSENNQQRSKLWKPREQYNGALAFHFKTKNTTWNLHSSLFMETIQSKGNAIINSTEAYAFDDYFKTTRGVHSLNTRFNVNSKWRVDMINGFSHYIRKKEAFLKDLQTLESNKINNNEENTQNNFSGIMMRAIFSPIKKQRLSLMWGYDFNLDFANADRISENTKYLGDFALFSMLDYQISKTIKLRPGVRAAYNTKFSTPITPSLNMMWTPNQKWQIRGSYGSGFRAPSLKEQYLLFVDINHNVLGNENLSSEVSHNFQLGADFKKYMKKYNLAYAFSANAYWNSVNNLIGLFKIEANSNMFTYQNYGRFEGGGIGIDQKISYKKTYFQGGFNYMLVKNQFRQETDRQVFFTPDINLFVSQEFSKHKIKANLFYKYNGSFFNFIQNELGNVSQQFVESFSFLDFTMSKSFMKNKLNFQTGVKNIFDVQNIFNINPLNSFHSGASNQMQLSLGRSLFIKVNYVW